MWRNKQRNWRKFSVLEWDLCMGMSRVYVNKISESRAPHTIYLNFCNRVWYVLEYFFTSKRAVSERVPAISYTALYIIIQFFCSLEIFMLVTLKKLDCEDIRCVSYCIENVHKYTSAQRLFLFHFCVRRRTHAGASVPLRVERIGERVSFHVRRWSKNKKKRKQWRVALFVHKRENNNAVCTRKFEL
jgi:hypothetical protein